LPVRDEAQGAWSAGTEAYTMICWGYESGYEISGFTPRGILRRRFARTGN